MASARAVEDPEDLRFEFVPYPAEFLRPLCAGRAGPLPVSKRCQRLAIVLADLPELRVASTPPTISSSRSGNRVTTAAIFDAIFASHHLLRTVSEDR